MPSKILQATLLVSLALGASGACASEDDAAMDDAVTPLDASEKQFGKSFAQWAEQWVQYVNSYHEPECANPLLDETGESCALYQDPEAPVFFLVGTFGGVTKRTCAVPADKALFFPLVNVWGDNAGVPEDMLLSSDDIETYVRNAYENVDPKRLWLRVDGEELGGLATGGVPAAQYTVDLPKGDNAYACAGVPGVEGEFDGWVSGYWVMLPPLSKGTHDVEFGVERGVDPLTGDPAQASFSLDIRYELHVD